MRIVTGLVVLAVLIVGAWTAAPAAQIKPEVAEINWFTYDECENVFAWETASEINNYAYHVQGNGWQSETVLGLHYPTITGDVYTLAGQTGADEAGDYVLCVYFDNGTIRCEDIAERICEMPVFTPTPTGGGGASFAFDGATFTPEAYDANSNFRSVDIELTLDGAAITTGTIWFMVAASKTGTFIADDGFVAADVIAQMSSGSLSDRAMRANTGVYNSTNLIVITPSGGHATATVVLENIMNSPGAVGYLVVFLPSGGIVVSDMIEIGAEPPPP